MLGSSEDADDRHNPIDKAMDGLLEVQHLAARSRTALSMFLGKFEPPSHSQLSDPVEIARLHLRFRRRRDSIFATAGYDGGVFGEPVWDMMLDLYVARSENIRIGVSSLCIASAVPATTALRYINMMVQNGLVTRHNDRKDGRRVFIELSDMAVELMDALLTP